VAYEESHTVPQNKDTNPNGNFYEIRKTAVTESIGLDANPFDHRVFKITNPFKKNTLSGNFVAYKFEPLPTQIILAAPGSTQAQRALFTNHHVWVTKYKDDVWVTKYKDDKLYATGRYTIQSQLEQGGVYEMAARKESVENTDLVVWNVFGLTHNLRFVLPLLPQLGKVDS
jgi:primary-amine oxidase